MLKPLGALSHSLRVHTHACACVWTYHPLLSLLHPWFSYLPQRSCPELVHNELTSNVCPTLPPAVSHCKKWLAGYASLTMSNVLKWPLTTTATCWWLGRPVAVVTENWSVYGHPLMSGLGCSSKKICHYKLTRIPHYDWCLGPYLLGFLNCRPKAQNKFSLTYRNPIVIWMYVHYKSSTSLHPSTTWYLLLCT